LNGSDQIQSLTTLDDLSGVSIANNSPIANCYRNGDAWSQLLITSEMIDPGLVLFWHRFVERRSLRKTLITLQDDRLIDDPSDKCRTVTDVDEIKSDFERVTSAPSEFVVSKPRMLQADFWPMRRIKLLPSKLNLFYPDLSQTACRQPQKNCSEEQKRGERADEKPFVAVHISDYSGREPNRAADNFGPFAVLAFLLVPAVVFILRSGSLLKM